MDDLISREAALNCFHDWIDKYGDVCTPDDMPEYRAIEALPSIQPEKCTEKRTETHSCDCIESQAAIDAVLKGRYSEDDSLVENVEECNSMIEWAADVLKNLPSAQPEVTEEAVKEYCRKRCLCIVDSAFLKYAFAEPEIIHCGECKHRDPEDHKCDCGGHDIIWQLPRNDKWYCADAERREE
jgi:hypothetical protein